jgi:hypothetical protein
MDIPIFIHTISKKKKHSRSPMMCMMTWMHLLFHSPIKPVSYFPATGHRLQLNLLILYCPVINRYNIFLITDFGDKAELNQVTQLSDLKYGDARFPTQYNTNHFTFVSDENGIGNRYAGFFTTRKKQAWIPLVLIGDDILRNPTIKELTAL